MFTRRVPVPGWHDALWVHMSSFFCPMKIGVTLETARCLVAAAEPLKSCHLPVPQMWAQPGPVLSFMSLPSWLCSKACKRVLALSILVHSVPLHLGILWHLMWNLSHSESERQTTPRIHTHSGLLVFKCFPVGLCIRPKLFVGDPGFDFFFYAKLRH